MTVIVLVVFGLPIAVNGELVVAESGQAGARHRERSRSRQELMASGSHHTVTSHPLR